MSGLHSVVHFIPIADLYKTVGERYLNILSYPSNNVEDSLARINEISSLGISHMAVEKIGDRYVPMLLGKGVRGVVFLGLLDGERVAIKLARKDSAVKDFSKEALMHKTANKYGVGPSLINHTDKLIIMEYVEGLCLGEYISKNPSNLEKVFREVLEQCYVLDVNGLDHGQLTNSSDHVIIRKDEKPVIIDFSHASATRNTSNLTSFTSYILHTLLRDHMHDPRIHRALKIYKEKKSEDNFRMVRDLVFELLNKLIHF